MGLDATNPVFGVSDKVRLKPVSSATKINYKNEASLVASLYMKLFKRRIKRCIPTCASAETDRHRCCSHTRKTGFSCVEAHVKTDVHKGLTHLCLASFLWDKGKQCRPISDSAFNPGLQCLLTKSSIRILIIYKQTTLKAA